MSLSHYYEENLYPVQDGIMNVLKGIETPFYLTGGTALSREHYNHRYSDDLDFFVNNDSSFRSYIDTFLGAIAEHGFSIDHDTLMMTPRFVSLFIKNLKNDFEVKADFVNDIESHYGGYTKGRLFPKIDSIRNILSNKIGAVFRLSGKDIADIREIALHEEFDWSEILYESRNKDLGIEANIVSEIINGTPKYAFEDIKWVNAPSWDVFKHDIERIAYDILHSGKNSVYIK